MGIMRNETDPFKASTGSDRLESPKFYVILLSVAVVSGWVITHKGIMAGLGLVALPFMVFFFYWLFRKPIVGFYATIILGFVLLGIGRYVSPDFHSGSQWTACCS